MSSLDNALFFVPAELYPHRAELEDLARITAFNRINSLSAITGARHGWLGASWSCAEILSVLYFGLGTSNVVLSKGHAAPMQYACLAGTGRIPTSALARYKDGPLGLPAHAVRSTPGVLVDSGSLGQALSKVAGLAWARPEERFFVILGDGELQEGQCWEAFQTLVASGHGRVLPILDRNGFQSQEQVRAIKPIADLAMALRGLGFDVETVDGHDPSALLTALRPCPSRPRLLIADTVKAGGSSLLAPRDGRQPWHGAVPGPELYLRLVAEQVERSGDPRLMERWAAFRATVEPLPIESPEPGSPRPSLPASTGEACGQALASLIEQEPALVVLDADLAVACRVDRLSGHPRFIEMGIAEQDMFSFAGGLALAGRIPVVNTFATFTRRALDQLALNLGEGARTLVAGHYAGLDYHTDGRTHQALDDLLLMSALPGLRIAEPALPEQVLPLLRQALRQGEPSLYLRLHRSGLELGPLAGCLDPDRPLSALVLGRDFTSCFLVSGPRSARLALDALEHPCFFGWGLIAPLILRPLELDPALLASCERVVVIEESLSPGILAGAARALIEASRSGGAAGSTPRFILKCCVGESPCFRRPEEVLAFQRFTVQELVRLFEEDQGRFRDLSPSST